MEPRDNTCPESLVARLAGEFEEDVGEKRNKDIQVMSDPRPCYCRRGGPFARLFCCGTYIRVHLPHSLARHIQHLVTSSRGKAVLAGVVDGRALRPNAARGRGPPTRCPRWRYSLINGRGILIAVDSVPLSPPSLHRDEDERQRLEQGSYLCWRFDCSLDLSGLADRMKASEQSYDGKADPGASFQANITSA